MVNLDETQEAALRRVVKARKRSEAANAEAREAIGDAVMAGVPWDRVGKAAHISRQSVWRILDGYPANVPAPRKPKTDG